MYCSKCGEELVQAAKFCSNCGQKVVGSVVKNTEMDSNSFETVSFSSRFVLGGSLLTPDRLVITSEELIYRKRNKNLIGVDEIAIPFKRISSVELDRKLISSTVIVYTMGNEKVRLKNFSIGDAKRIREALTKRLNK